MVQLRFSGMAAGPGSRSFSGYCGNTGEGNFAPLGAGTFTGAVAVFMRRLCISTSIRNFGAVAMRVILPRFLSCGRLVGGHALSDLLADGIDQRRVWLSCFCAQLRLENS